MLNFETNCCPNPNCQQKLEKIIIIHEDSTNNTKFHFACPHCGFKLDPKTTQLLKKEEKIIEEKTEIKPLEQEREIPSGCPKYLGYLTKSKDSIILMECLTCPKMAHCMIEKEY